ncbi:MAG: hypothetical protein H0T77_10455 [Pyrinomonadaceae bacterium]|nr:hypothetical protein [Pyrinomonadaceae bacterium]
MNRGIPPGFWEVMNDEPVTGSILQSLTEDLDNGKVIYRSWASPINISVKTNNNNYCWKSSAFVTRKLKELYELNGKNSVWLLLGESLKPILDFEGPVLMRSGGFA